MRYFIFIIPAIFAVFFIAVVVIILKNMTAVRNSAMLPPPGFVPGGEDLPVESGAARVVSKRRSRRGSNGGTSYYITFEIENNLKEIRVFSPTFYSVSEGDEGMLSYRGNMLIEFKKNM